MIGGNPRSERPKRAESLAVRRPRNTAAFGIIVGLAMLSGIAVLFAFPAQDRLLYASFEVFIVGLGFIIFGATTAAERTLTTIDDALHRNRGITRRRLVPLPVLETIYAAGTIFGFCRAFLQPRRTWPALLWIVTGLLIVVAAVILICVLDLGRL